MAKAQYVLDRVLKEDYEEVIVFEDNVRNLRTIRKELTPTGVKLKTNRVGNKRITSMTETKKTSFSLLSIIGESYE